MQKIAQFFFYAITGWTTSTMAEPPLATYVPTRTAQPAGAAPSIASNPPLVLSGDKQKINTQCGGRNAEIKGNNNHIVLEGFCNAVTVKGNNNRVWVMQSYELNAIGNRNHIYWKEKMGGSILPTVTKEGKENLIKQRSK